MGEKCDGDIIHFTMKEEHAGVDRAEYTRGCVHGGEFPQRSRDAEK